HVGQQVDRKPMREQECLCAALSGAADEQFKHAATVCGQEGPGWLFGGIRRGHARNIDAPEGEYESAEARRDEPGREGALQTCGPNKARQWLVERSGFGVRCCLLAAGAPCD